MFDFAWQWALFLIPLPVLVRLLLTDVPDQQSTALRTSLFRQWRSISMQNNQRSWAHLGHILLSTILWLCLITAIARPQWIGEPIELPVSGRDLLISIDISGSMQQQDLSLDGQVATRLDVVKGILADFIERRDGDRLGLILFGERAYLQTPLTFDLSTVRHMLEETEIGLAGASRTAIGDGIGLAVKRLKQRPAENRVLVLLTDGQNNAGALDPIEAAKLAEHAEVKIYTIGVGADEMLIRDSLFGTRKVNPSQELDEATLTQVAELTGGRYFRARDQRELIEIYRLLDLLEPIQSDQQVYRPIDELYLFPLVLGMSIYIFVWILSQLNKLLRRRAKVR